MRSGMWQGLVSLVSGALARNWSWKEIAILSVAKVQSSNQSSWLWTRYTTHPQPSEGYQRIDDYLVGCSWQSNCIAERSCNSASSYLSLQAII